MYTAGSDTEFDVEDICQLNEEDDDVSETLHQDAYGDLGKGCGCKDASDDDDDDEIFFVGIKDDNEITDDTVKDYVKSVENLQKNGSTTKETVESFKKAIKALQDFDADAIEKELAKGAKNPKVHSLYVMMHLKEALEKSGFKQIAFQSDATSGSVILKNDKTETYVQMQYSREKGKEGASVKIEQKK